MQQGSTCGVIQFHVDVIAGCECKRKRQLPVSIGGYFIPVHIAGGNITGIAAIHDKLKMTKRASKLLDFIQ